MPHYDESFIHDDNVNQRRNKRSYRVYKQGGAPAQTILEPSEVLHALEGRGTSVIKKNIRNLKQRNARKQATDKLHRKNPDIIEDHCPVDYGAQKFYDLRNNNVSLASCKSLDSLAWERAVGRARAEPSELRTGVSLYNLAVAPVATETRRRCLPAPPPGARPASLDTGVYRQINCERDSPFRTRNEGESCEGSGHRGSLRGANKLARRARSFKDDLLERISAMRSPGQPHQPLLLSALRSHSPLSPKMRNAAATKPACDDGELTPAKELEQLVSKVKFGLKHLCDVISKQKLEMLPGNGNIVLDDIACIHRAIKPYCGTSASLCAGVQRLCAALAQLLRLCDEATAPGERAAAALAPAHVAAVVEGVRAAVRDVSALALQHMARPALAPRPALVPGHRRPNSQRNSLPDIPLTPKERSLLTEGVAGAGGVLEGGVRASHSSESVLDAPDLPPPKPPRPNSRKMGQAPPLPPKKKTNEPSLAICTDRVSLQSHSSGSLDSMLNVSHEDEAALAHRSATSDHFALRPERDTLGVCSCDDSTLSDNISDTQAVHSHTNHNRFSNESGFVSMGQNSVVWSDISAGTAKTTSAHAEFSQFSLFESVECSSEVTRFELSRVNNVTSASLIQTNGCRAEDGVDGAPPALPAKTRRARADLQHHFPDIEIRQSACTLHGEPRPHTLAESARPPPLPLKKKHIMAYMEMFGNCSHPPTAGAGGAEMFRHSIHTYNLASNNAQGSSSCSLSSTQLSYQHVQHAQHAALAQSLTLQHFGTAAHLSSSEDSVSATPAGGASPVPPPALPPKMNKAKQIENLPSVIEPRPLSETSAGSQSDVSHDDLHPNNLVCEDSEAVSPGKFPLEEDYPPPHLAPSPTPSPTPSRGDSDSVPDVTKAEAVDETDVVLLTDVAALLRYKAPEDDGAEIRGGHPDALVVHATKNAKDFAFGEAFLSTYRTWVTPRALVGKLTRRARHLRGRPHHLRPTLALFTRVVADLTTADMDGEMVQDIMDFIYWLVCSEELPMAKELRQKLLDKQRSIQLMACSVWEGYGPAGSTSLKRDTLLDFKASELAEQMTLLDASLFARITTAEVLAWPRDQSEETSPNLTRFTEHFNKMSYWARTRILMQEEARDRERYVQRLLKVMKHLRKINNFNSYLAVLSALDCGPVRRLSWPRALLDAIQDHTRIIDSTCSFKYYRQMLADTHPPCIPYIGLVLQDLTFVHIGNQDLLPDGSINFSKRWQQYQIIESMKKFHMGQYTFRRNEAIIAMLNGFDDVLSEEAMWQISEALKPRSGRARPAPLASAPAPAPPPLAPQPTA